MHDNDIRVLCVDDQSDATALLERHLAPHFPCDTVNSAASAYTALEAGPKYAIVVTDYTMPDVNGAELMAGIKRRWPDTIGVLITASDAIEVAITALNEGNIYRFVRKPWRAEDILIAVNDAAAYFRLVASERRLRDQLSRANAELDEKVQDLDEANELLEYWVEYSPAVLYSFTLDDVALRPSYISKNFVRLSGFERTAAVIESGFWRSRIGAADRARYDSVIAALLDGALVHAVLEYTISHKSGSAVRVLDSLRAVHDGDGRTIEIVGAWMDVSARL